MKKIIVGFVALVFAVMANQTSAQNFSKGDQFVQAGVGFGSAYIGSGLNRGLPPVHVSYEYGITDKIGVGGLIGTTSARSGKFSGGGEYKYSYTIVGGRVAYHFYEKEKLDLYGGAMLGYNIASVKYKGSHSALVPVAHANGGLAVGAFVGARYFIHEKFHLMAEAGYTISFISVGIGIKL